MAKINKQGGAAVALSTMSGVAEQVLSNNAVALADEGLVKNMVGMENFHEYAPRENTSESVKNSLDAQLTKELGLRTGAFTSAQLEAAAIVAMAKADPVAYATAAMSTQFAGLESGQNDAPLLTSGQFGRADIFDGQSVGLEYFNETSLDTHMATSLVFNLQAARQDEFCEAFFRTITIDPSECGMLVEINKTMVHRAVRHAMNHKDSQPFQRRNVLDAATDYTVLEDRAVDFIPYMNVDGSRDNEFCPASLHTPTVRRVENAQVRTNPLRFTPFDKHLMELSAHPGLVTSGILDESDEFDGRVALDNLYILAKKKGEDDSKGKLIKFNTQHLARASFNKSQEGDGREMSLEFRGAHFTLTQETKAVDKSDIPALEELAANKYTLIVTVKVNANINLQTGVESAMVSGVTIVGLRDERGHDISWTQGAGQQIVDGIDLSGFCYDYKMTRSNSNRRSKGLLVDSVCERERYKIQLGSPITSRKPIGRTDNNGALNDLITTARMRNNNLAITKLLNYTDALEQVVAGITNEYEIPSIEGAGRHYVRPWFEKVTFDAQKQTAALQSDDVPNALRAALLNVLRDQIVRAYQESRFQPALEMLSGYTISKPKVVIGTDITTGNWLWVQGDVRTLGDQFQYKIVTTTDFRFNGRLQWVFSVGEEGYSCLNFGNFLWVPELVTDTNLTRNDAVANEITVQPRCYHVVNCPITGVIIVVGLSDYVTSKPSIGVQRMTAMGDVIEDNVIDTPVGPVTP